jgi:hypothetical protein
MTKENSIKIVKKETKHQYTHANTSNYSSFGFFNHENSYLLKIWSVDLIAGTTSLHREL